MKEELERFAISIIKTIAFIAITWLAWFILCFAFENLRNNESFTLLLAMNSILLHFDDRKDVKNG